MTDDTTPDGGEMTIRQLADLINQRSDDDRARSEDQIDLHCETMRAHIEIVGQLTSHIQAPAASQPGTPSSDSDATRHPASTTPRTILGLSLALALALGILIQQQFAPLGVPDPTHGWKDRVWARVGPTIAQCMFLEDAGAGDCIVTITTPGE